MPNHLIYRGNIQFWFEPFAEIQKSSSLYQKLIENKLNYFSYKITLTMKLNGLSPKLTSLKYLVLIYVAISFFKCLVW